MKILENHAIPNSLKIKSISKYYIEIDSSNSFDELHQFLIKKDLPILIIGEGTNVVLNDFFNGVVIRPLFNNILIQNQLDKIPLSDFHVSVGASVNWHKLVNHMIENKIFGFENLSLIPGSVGAAPIQNIGAYGQEVSNLIKKVHCYDYKKGKFVTLSNKDCNFSYRSSSLQNSNLIIFKIDFNINNNKTFNLDYKSLQNYIVNNNINKKDLNLKKISDIVCTIRNLNLPNPDVTPNAGSFFKNAIIKKEEINTAHYSYDELIIWKVNDKYVKVGSARLIELIKDSLDLNPRVMIFKNHSLVLITNGEATQKDVLDYANHIKNRVLEIFNISLEIEPTVITN